LVNDNHRHLAENLTLSGAASALFAFSLAGCLLNLPLKSGGCPLPHLLQGSKLIQQQI